MVRAANNNNVRTSKDVFEASRTAPGTPRETRSKRYPIIHTDLPDDLPILDAEVKLIQTYLSEIIGSIISNDNES